ncbi:MAG: hypothetical protein KDD60_06255, partial [Bdellovibrionales bacterium]|nr:hypothetical protein [Bdellovibrionales bacterium]
LLHHFDSESRFKLQTELYLQDRSEGVSTAPEEALEFQSNPLGFYVIGDYRFSKHYGIGSRFDYVDSVNESHFGKQETLGYSSYITYHQSEFFRFRFQYQYADLPTGDDNRFFFQVTAAIGVHQHQLQ